MKNVHTLPVTITYARGDFDSPEPQVYSGEKALLEKIRLGLPSIVYQKLGELFGDNLHGFHIQTTIYDELELEKESILYIQTSLDAKKALELEDQFEDWWFYYSTEHNINFSEYPVITIEFVGRC